MIEFNKTNINAKIIIFNILYNSSIIICNILIEFNLFMLDYNFYMLYIIFF